MYIREETLDDLLNKIYTKLLKKRDKIVASKGSFKEITGVLLHLKKPRARLSRAEGKGKLFSCLGELTWYLAGSKDLKFISYYTIIKKAQMTEKPYMVLTARDSVAKVETLNY